MIGYVREKLKEQRAANGESIERIKEVDTLLDSNALTIGFARRFATYKRANLIFRDLARIQKLLNNPEKPVQIIFAGKAHLQTDLLMKSSNISMTLQSRKDSTVKLF